MGKAAPTTWRRTSAGGVVQFTAFARQAHQLRSVTSLVAMGLRGQAASHPVIGANQSSRSAVHLNWFGGFEQRHVSEDDSLDKASEAAQEETLFCSWS